MAVATEIGAPERTTSLVNDGIKPAEARPGLLVRWVVLFSGSPETDEYYPAASRGESDALTREVGAICNAFHPASQMQSFPRESAAWMFWKARSTGDWVVTRVTVAPNLQGQRTTLEYCNLLFDEASFQALRCNPFRTRSLNLHDRVRKNYLARRKEPFLYSLPAPAAAANVGLTAPEECDNPEALTADHQAVISDICRIIPGMSEERLSNDANLGAIQEFCSRWQDRPEAPPTFATWWPSRNPVPEDRFDVVLQASAPVAMTWHEAARSVTGLVTDVKLMLPSPPSADKATIGLIRSILNTCTEAELATNRAAERIHTETAFATQTQLESVIMQFKDLATQLGTLAQRFTGHLSVEETECFTHLIDRSQDLQVSLTLVVSRNPFQSSGHRISNAKPLVSKISTPKTPPAKTPTPKFPIAKLADAKSSDAMSAFVSVKSQPGLGSNASVETSLWDPSLGNSGSAPGGIHWSRILLPVAVILSLIVWSLLRGR